jgi:CelD/BcsL family acetyltransferase involved in cellulose biosynthesis
VEHYGDLEIRGWKRTAGTAVHRSNTQGRFYQEVLCQFAEQGNGIVYELYLDDCLVASQLAIGNGSILITLKTTFNEAFRKYSPGRVLDYLTLQQEFELGRFAKVEFCTNAGPDLIRWGHSTRSVSHLTVYRNRYALRLMQLYRKLNRLKTSVLPVGTADRDSHRSLPMTTELLTSEQDWQALRHEWDDLLAGSVFPSVFMSFDYLHTAFPIFHEGESQPFILTVRDSSGELIGIVPLRRSYCRRWGIRYAVLEYLVTWEIDKPYLIACRDQEDTVWCKVFEFLDANTKLWDVLKLREVPDMLDGARNIEKLFISPDYRVDREPGSDGPIVDLTQGWEAFLAKHKQYRRALSELNKLDAGYKLTNYENPDNIEEGVERYLELERLTWKPGNVGLQKNTSHKKFYLSVIPALTKEGRASIHFLETSEGRYIAGIVCLSFGRTLYPQHTVYDLDYSHYSPGKLLLGLVLGRHMTDRALTTADLLCGFADYYYPWAARIDSTTNISVTRLTPVMQLQQAVYRLKRSIGKWF